MSIPWGGSGYKVPIANDGKLPIGPDGYTDRQRREVQAEKDHPEWSENRKRLVRAIRPNVGENGSHFNTEKLANEHGKMKPSTDTDHDEMPSMSEDKKFTEDLHSRKSDGKFIESSGNSQQKHKRPTK